MKNTLKTAAKYFKYASILFLISYSIYIVIDDFVFIKKISNLAEGIEILGLDLQWLAAYYLVFSIYYWLTAFMVVFVYHKLKKSTRP